MQANGKESVFVRSCVSEVAYEKLVLSCSRFTQVVVRGFDAMQVILMMMFGFTLSNIRGQLLLRETTVISFHSELAIAHVPNTPTRQQMEQI